MSDGMGRELAYLSSHATNRYFIPNWGIHYIEKHFSVCRDEKVIDDVRNRVAAYEDSIRHHHEMVEMATYKDSIANKLLQESNRIKRAMKSSK